MLDRWVSRSSRKSSPAFFEHQSRRCRYRDNIADIAVARLCARFARMAAVRTIRFYEPDTDLWHVVAAMANGASDTARASSVVRLCIAASILREGTWFMRRRYIYLLYDLCVSSHWYTRVSPFVGWWRCVCVGVYVSDRCVFLSQKNFCPSSRPSKQEIFHNVDPHTYVLVDRRCRLFYLELFLRTLYDWTTTMTIERWRSKHHRRWTSFWSRIIVISRKTRCGRTIGVV